MRIFLVPLFARLSPLVLALVLAGAFSADREQAQPIPDDECVAFSGVSVGNDPTQSMVLELCRQGDEIRGIRISEGMAGTTIFHLVGKIQEHQMKLRVSAVELNAPARGWLTCTDDQFTLVWQPIEQVLSGVYISEECQDIAGVKLVPVIR